MDGRAFAFTRSRSGRARFLHWARDVAVAVAVSLALTAVSWLPAPVRARSAPSIPPTVATKVPIALGPLLSGAPGRSFREEAGERVGVLRDVSTSGAKVCPDFNFTQVPSGYLPPELPADLIDCEVVGST